MAPLASRSPAEVMPGVESAYDILLGRCFTGFEEATLLAAHELGREALVRGLGLLDMVELHNRLLARHLVAHAPSMMPDAVEAAGRLLVECLTPFEMVHRGFQTANSALKTSDDRYRDLFENANDAIFTTDLHGRMTSINAAGERLSGFTRDEALTLKLASLIAPDDTRPARRRRPLRFGVTEARQRYELDIMTRDGKRVPVEVSTRPLYESGRIAGVQGIARDISDRRNAQSALRYINNGLEAKAKRIAHGLHDEAGQLLASVYLRIAEIAAELPPAGRRRVEDLRTLLDQVDDQIRRLAHELHPSMLDELGLIPACQLLATGVSKRGGLRVAVSGSTRGRLNPETETALYRVVQEGLTNVMRHAHARNVTVKIERIGHRLRGHIRDDGDGFDQAQQARRHGGKGLGLIGMRERLLAVGGRLQVTSRPGRGTSVDFELPLEG